ncbi:hypothetical protein H9M94_01960 [Mycoplasma sp. Pen4]|uniref:hypothetical protein n=1 Tax=Mycoplasma sp. Pen4 TaxID=640330 RepID=UPI0016540461|nr:hypothetical protein [Mycoplasma sp. Pen4]QNM93372.1 hypothetical protein H9M94_01960 [Mycoplasma sp. Pen4]
MKIKFHSHFTHSLEDKEGQVIEFTAPLDLEISENAYVFDFYEPKENQRNKIEVLLNKNIVSIFNNTATVNLQLEKYSDVWINFLNPQTNKVSELFLQSFCTEFNKNIADNNFNFKYKLYNENDLENPIGYFNITLTWFE